VAIKEQRYLAEIPIQFILLHSNEKTAATVTNWAADSLGIDFLQIINGGSRLIEFEWEKKRYRFDPNRIFSDDGIEASLRLHSHYSNSAFEIALSFRDSILQLLRPKKTIVSMHNNTDGAFSLLTYRSNNAGMVHQNRAHDVDDFIITNDSLLFEKAKVRGLNIVLEYSNRLKDDGSLSLYCSRNGIPYVNIEAEHGHENEQAAMLLAVIEILK
jgi:hypothetical protein